MAPNLVSVIMPAYNGEAYIVQAIESVLVQEYEQWELLVVDDGSIDNTAAIVSSFEDPRIRYAYQENRGQAAALNHGLELARGTYVTTLDVDDWLTTNSLRDRVQFLDRYLQYGAVYGDGYYCDVDGNPIGRFSEYHAGNATGDVYDVLITSPFFGTGANVTIRREVLVAQCLQYDESIIWCQDYDLYIRMAENTAFGYVEAILLWYRLHDANMTMSMPAGRRLDSLVKTKYKVLDSARFSKVTPSARVDFFYELLSLDLFGRVADQTQVFQHPQFQALPKQDQASLLRIVANDYLLRGEESEQARAWLKQARRLTPFDLKTISISAMAGLNPKLTRRVLKYWRQNATQEQAGRSPLEFAKKA